MQRLPSALATAFVAALIAVTAGCGGGGASPFVAPPPPPKPSIVSINFGTPNPNATPCPSACSTTFTVSEPGYNGAFHGSSSNTNVVTIALLGSVNQARTADANRIPETTVATFQATAVGTGTATITITDDNGNSSTIPVTVTSGLSVITQLQH